MVNLDEPLIFTSPRFSPRAIREWQLCPAKGRFLVLNRKTDQLTKQLRQVAFLVPLTDFGWLTANRSFSAKLLHFI